MKSPRLYVAAQAGRRAASFFLATSFAVFAVSAGAGEARVDAVQWPAWVERSGDRFPAQPGLELQSGDRLLTGRNARLLLRLADGSAVKVGEQADVVLDSVDRQDGVLNAAIQVGKGAFRFTTGLFAKVLGTRQVRIRVSTLTIGIRGTDVWGKSDADRDLVLLIEGRVGVTHAGGVEQELATPLEYLAAPRGQGPERKAADPGQVAEWAKETEGDPMRPSGRTDGRFSATVVVAASEAEALSMWETLRAAGYPVRLRPLGGERYALRVGQLGTTKEARALAAEARSRLGAASAQAPGGSGG